MASKDSIPFLDLIRAHHDLENELSAVFRQTLATANFVGGPMVQQFEDAFAAFCGITHCVGVGSGTDALRFALIAAGIQPVGKHAPGHGRTARFLRQPSGDMRRGGARGQPIATGTVAGRGPAKVRRGVH